MTIAEVAPARGASSTHREHSANPRFPFRRMLEELHAMHTVLLTRIDGEDTTESDPDDELVLRIQSSSQHWLLGEIEDALRRLADSAYGVCEDCRADIPPRRLETIPYARRCVACQRRSVS